MEARISMTNIALFEVDAVDVDRFFCVPLNLGDEVRLVLIDQPSEFSKYQEFGQLRGDRVHLSAWKTLDQLTDLFLEHKIDLLILNASRIVDMYVALAARAAGVRISYIQHGMYIPFMKRNASFFIRKFAKAARYLIYAGRASWRMRDTALFFHLFGVHVLGTDRRPLSKHRSLFPDQGVAFSDYWKAWHVQHYAFPTEILSTIGTPDLNKHKFGPVLAENDVAYCYQTLIEDGRIGREQMYRAYREMQIWAENADRRIVVKTHPRGAAEHYRFLESLGFVLEAGCVPNAPMVIGHYSSLMAYWGLAGRRVIAVKLPGHEVHESIAPWAEVVDTFSGIRGIAAGVDVSHCAHYFGNPASVREIRRLVGID
jgi:hypothetical protein